MKKLLHLKAILKLPLKMTTNGQLERLWESSISDRGMEPVQERYIWSHTAGPHYSSLGAFSAFFIKVQGTHLFSSPPIVLDVQMPNSHNLSSDNDFFSQVPGDETVHNFEAFNRGNQCVSQCQLQC